jgi:CheY-like chemotaxis protein
MVDRILIVDDYADDREMYASFLSKRGYQVDLAADGKEALAKAFGLIPDLIIMDLSLPKIGGWDATRQIKASEKTKHIPVVILTAHIANGPAAVVKKGCEGFLLKPCVPEELHKEIVRVLDRQKQQFGPRTSSSNPPDSSLTS